MAPEIHAVFKDPSVSYNPFEADIFALGVIFFCLVFGKLPFEYATPQNPIYSLITKNEMEEFWKTHNSQV